MAQHQVHNVEGAGAEVGEEEIVATVLVEQEEEWEQQTGWSKAASQLQRTLIPTLIKNFGFWLGAVMCPACDLYKLIAIASHPNE